MRSLKNYIDAICHNCENYYNTHTKVQDFEAVKCDSFVFILHAGLGTGGKRVVRLKNRSSSV